jgi:tetratricopeptide (TPR) repeat protein
MLRRRIDSCKGVVQLVGKCYGGEPPTVDQQFGRVSYTQYEALYAGKKGKKTWYLFLDENFPSDLHEAEDEEKQNLQGEYRARVKAAAHLYHPLSTNEGLEASVLKLRDDLAKLRSGVRRWAAFVAGLLMLIVALSVWLLQSEEHSSQQLQTVQEKLEKLQQGVNSFAEVQNKVRQEQPGQKPAELEQRTYEDLGKELGLDPAVLKEQLPRFAEELKKAPNATTYERANAAYVAKDYNEAERLALAAADEAQRASPPKNTEAIKAFELAAWAAEKRIEYADALKQLRNAEELTDRARDGEAWARVQFVIAWVLDDRGQYPEAERILHDVLAERDRCLGPEHPDTLATRYRLGIELDKQGKSAEAEMEFSAVIKLREKVLGPEHPDTLATRNNLAIVLDEEGKSAEAETEFSTVIKLKEKVLGPEHPDTLATRSGLAEVLLHQGESAEAEIEARTVLKLQENVQGSEHPDTLKTCFILARCLRAQREIQEAGTLAQRAADGARKVLGPEHPDTKKYEQFRQELSAKGT